MCVCERERRRKRERERKEGEAELGRCDPLKAAQARVTESTSLSSLLVYLPSSGITGWRWRKRGKPKIVGGKKNNNPRREQKNSSMGGNANTLRCRASPCSLKIQGCSSVGANCTGGDEGGDSANFKQVAEKPSVDQLSERRCSPGLCQRGLAHPQSGEACHVGQKKKRHVQREKNASIPLSRALGGKLPT